MVSILKIAQALAKTDIFLVLSIFKDSSDNAESGIATDNFNMLLSHVARATNSYHVDIVLWLNLQKF